MIEVLKDVTYKNWIQNKNKRRLSYFGRYGVYGNTKRN